MNLKQLQYFKRLAELQHFTQTAEELYISQPSLSYSITSLENELGTPLLEKRGRNVVLTKGGKEFYRYVSAALDQLEEGISQLQLNTGAETGRIDLAVIPTVLSDYLPGLLKEYGELYPGNHVEIYSGPTKDIFEGITSGAYDVGICSAPDDGELAMIPLLKQDFVYLTVPDHPYGQKASLTLEEAAAFPVYTYRDSLVIGQTVRSAFQQNGVELEVIQSLDDETGLGSMAAHGFGPAIAADTSLLRQFELLRIPIEFPDRQRLVYLTYDNRRFKTDPVQQFLDFFKTKGM